jgi:hypothetical protein
MHNVLKRPADRFTMVPNALLEDVNLSMKAKGLYSLMFSKPDGWKFFEDNLVQSSKDGKEAVKTALKELEVAGWITRTRSRSSGQQFQPYTYQLNLEPLPQDVVGVAKNPQPISRCGKAAAENPTYNNTLNTKTEEVRTSHTLPAKTTSPRGGFEKSLGKVLRVGTKPNSPASAMTGKLFAEEFPTSKVPSDWIRLAMMMRKWTDATAQEAARRFAWYYTQGPGKGVRGEDAAMWSQRWTTWIKKADAAA